jgi:ABC-2 type transport system permease protein
VSNAPGSPTAAAGVANAQGDDGSSIYDLGYRRYEGVRLGRRSAIGALYRESLRAAFGLGRSTGAKVGPAILITIALFPAMVQLIISALIPADIEVIRASEYYGGVKFILALYVAVVAPDIVGRDQRTRSLTLYFTRGITRSDYALGKLAAMTTAMLAITLLPQALLFAGNALSTADFGAYARREWTQLFPIVGTAFAGSLLIASIGTLIAAQTPQRAFATVGIVVAFVLPIAVAAVMIEDVGGDLTRLAVFASPLDLVDGMTLWMFREAPSVGSIVAQAGYDTSWYGVVGAVVALVATVLLIWRYYRVQA